ncbi:MAG: leucine-rich repeat domain-containing protein [Eubacteriales bacterium]
MIKNRLAKTATLAALICTAFMVLFLFTGCSPSSSSPTDTDLPEDVRKGGNFYYSDVSDDSGEVIIRGIVNPKEIDGKPLQIPSAIGSKKVVGIGDNAFNSVQELTDIMLPEDIETIGSQAFYNCDHLARITIPAKVNYIGEGAFESCDALKVVRFEDGSAIEKIEKRTFYGCTLLDNIKLPSSLKTIDEYAFCNNESLTFIDLPMKLESIGSYAFCACDKLEEISVPSSVKNMGAHVFFGCDALTIYLASKNVPSTWDPNWNSSGCEIK